MKSLKDSNGVLVKAGDVIVSSYGIPPRRLEGKVIERDGKLIVLTPDSNPKESTLHSFKYHLHEFWIKGPNGP